MEAILAILFIAAVILVVTISKSKQKPKEEMFKITNTSHDNVIEFKIELNEEEVKRRIADGSLTDSLAKKEPSIKDVTGFYGFESNSPNKEYCVYSCDGHYENEKWQNGNLALLCQGKLLYKKRIQRPHSCKVSNGGVVICCDWLNKDELVGKFLVFDKEGELIFSRRTSANLGSASISDDSKFAIFETYSSDTSDSNKIFIVDIDNKKILKKLERPIAFKEVEIDSDTQLIKLKDRRNFVYEINFEGRQTNRSDYEKQIFDHGSVLDKLELYQITSEKNCLQDEVYLNILLQAVNDREACDRLRKENIYRSIGEWYLANDHKKMAVENWERALQINPKVGLKRKVESLKKELQ
ncbi:MAG TPA: hypothetical protein VNT20_14240 [Flavisolibacter sp.]|jgi:hypothetical protein|nr:hypothetical protein [Flavisolibacter sp.]